MGLEVEGLAFGWRKPKAGHKDGRMDPEVNKFAAFTGESDTGRSDQSVLGRLSRFFQGCHRSFNMSRGSVSGTGVGRSLVKETRLQVAHISVMKDRKRDINEN